MSNNSSRILILRRLRLKPAQCPKPKRRERGELNKPKMLQLTAQKVTKPPKQKAPHSQKKVKILLFHPLKQNSPSSQLCPISLATQ